MLPLEWGRTSFVLQSTLIDEVELRSRYFKNVITKQLNLLYVSNNLKIPLTFTEIGDMVYPEFSYIDTELCEKHRIIQEKIDGIKESMDNKIPNSGYHKPPSANHLNSH